MCREKTEIELNETPQGEAVRLRGALFAISLTNDLAEAHRIALVAMRGELHGHEIEPCGVRSPLASA